MAIKKVSLDKKGWVEESTNEVVDRPELDLKGVDLFLPLFSGSGTPDEIVASGSISPDWQLSFTFDGSDLGLVVTDSSDGAVFSGTVALT
jgi:hypothetical protein